MSGRTTQVASIDGRRLRLTHLDKVLYPATGTTKAEVIDYYVRVAPAMLPHLSGRPVTRKRWAEGVEGPTFFEKNLPTSAPDWLGRARIDGSAVYPVFESRADLAWAAQVAALELHVPQWRFTAQGTPGPPDRLVLDLDPGPGVGLAECARVAVLARELLADLGVTPLLPVTSGNKGLHLYAPMERGHDAPYLNAFAKQFAEALEHECPGLVTATMAKRAREGKVFVDWSQNNGSKTTLCPYSLRGNERPTVAAPRTWDELADPMALSQLTFVEVLQRLADDGDPLADLAPPVDRLSTYRSMRDPARTPEPMGGAPGRAPVFVIQRHQARRLHWDFRLEHDGVLASWALPRGVPDNPAEGRLAVPTEDHPLGYADFEGEIPGGEYGAGSVRIWDRGRLEVQKWNDDEILVTLTGRPAGGLGGEPVGFALIRTDQGWLLHRRRRTANASGRERPTASFVEPMLASTDTAALDRHPGEWSFEPKWDGIRAVAVIGDGVLLYSRNRRDIGAEHSHVVRALAAVPAGTVLDGELVVFDGRGRPDFGLLQRHAEPSTYLLFDVLRLAGRDTTADTQRDRRRALVDLELDESPVRTPPTFEGLSLQDALALSREHGLEGVVAKRLGARYLPGRRSPDWVKLKHEQTQSVVVGGWRAGYGDGVGSLLVGIPDGTGLKYAGRVGSGFSEAERRSLHTLLAEAARETSPFTAVPAAVATDAHWVEPVHVAEVTHRGHTSGGLLRHASWRGLRQDQETNDVHPE